MRADILLLLPVIIPLMAAVLSLLAYRRTALQRVLAPLAMALLLGAAIALLATVWHRGVVATQLGGWPAPFGITFVADLLSAVMVAIAGLMGLAVSVYSLATVDDRREAFGYYPLFHVLLMGVCGAFLTGDLFNLYVWFEVMLMASFVLLALGGERGQMEGAIKYVTLNLVSSMIFLTAVGILYGVVGTLNMSDLAQKLGAAPRGLVTALAMLFLVAFGIKAAAFPLFFWLPASYHTPPVAVSAVFAGLLTKVGVYALIRVFTLCFVQDVAYTHTILVVVAGLTMVTGVLGAVAQNEFRRILSFHIVSQIGYMLMGLGLFSPLALAGSIFYIVHHIIVKTNLFLASGVAQRLRGTYELKRLGGLYASYPLLAALFLVAALTLAGQPPFSGFWAKLVLLRAGLEQGQYAIVATGFVVSLLTLFSMTKIWAEAFWKPAPDDGSGGHASPVAPGLTPPNRREWALLVAPIAALTVVSLGIGLAPEASFTLATRAAEQLLDPSAYIDAVMGARQ